MKWVWEGREREREERVHTVTAACGRSDWRRENSRYLCCIYKSSCREFLYDSRHRIRHVIDMQEMRILDVRIKILLNGWISRNRKLIHFGREWMVDCDFKSSLFCHQGCRIIYGFIMIGDWFYFIGRGEMDFIQQWMIHVTCIL